MGIKLYKDDKECDADADQVSIMTEAGWSTEKPEPTKKEKDKTAAELAADEKKAADEKAKSTTTKTGN